MVLGFIHQGPEQVFGFLLQKYGDKAVRLLMPSDIPPSSKTVKHLVIFDFSDFEQNATLLRMMKYKIYVFNSGFELSRWGIAPEDSDADKISDVEFSGGIRTARHATGSPMIERVLDLVRKYSLFGDLMAIIYDLPSKTGQKPATQACCKWLVSRDPDLKVLRVALTPIIKKKHSVLEAIMKIMERPIAVRLQTALTEVADGAPIDEAARRNKVRPYEISYVLGSLERKLDATDIYVQNTGED